jgi:pimeloyl-ACP methyl ester carboxylesterase
VSAGLPGLTIIAPDMLGHGRSGPWDGRSDFHGLATRQAMALRARMGPGPVHLIGHSSGATIALRMALEDAEGIASLTLIEPVLFAAARAANAAVFAKHQDQHVDYVLALQAGEPARAAAEFQKIWGMGRSFETLTKTEQTYITDRIGVIEAQQVALADDAAGLLAYGRLEALGIPVLLLEGAKSPPVIGAINAELARRLPQVTRATVAGAGHMLPITHPAECAALIRGFLAKPAET